MAIKLYNLLKRSNKKKKRIGRGNASGHGTYSTRGLKGQKARSGVSGLKLLGMKRIILATPKLKGFKSIKAGTKATITLSMLDNRYDNGEKVNLKTLLVKNLITPVSRNVKIVSNGELTKKLEVSGCMVSAKAKEAIEKVGGKILETK